MFQGSDDMKSVTNPQYFIGLMSGTSMDGVDGVLVTFEQDTLPQVQKLISLPMPDDLRQELLSLNQAGENELERAALAANKLTNLYAQCCHQLLQQTGLKADQITAIGAHGQTVRHRPDLGFTIQLNSPARLAELTGIDVVADFRSRDIAAGGQGAPFAPLLHHALFADPQKTRVVLNLGGIANVTLLRPNQPLLGFDTGPANVLMDTWIHRIFGSKFDRDGILSTCGEIQRGFLELMLTDPYFAQAAPKSTGRDLFNEAWLDKRLDQWRDAGGFSFSLLHPDMTDILATLRALTSYSVVQAIQRYCAHVDEVIVCGGGSKNLALMDEIRKLIQCDVKPIDDYGLDCQAVEALAFAWLAKAFVDKTPLDFPSITGSRKATIAGAWYPR